MILVGIFVIAPKMAQHIMDTSTIELTNLTMNPCNTLEAWLQNTAVITLKAPLPISTKIHSYNQSVYTTTCGTGFYMQGGYACENPNTTLLGTYMAPAMDMKIGNNHKKFGVRMDLLDQSTIILGLMAPLFPMNFPPGNKARLILTASDVTVSLPLGIKISGLKMHNELTCTGQNKTPQVPIPNSICYPKDASHAPTSNPGYYLKCVNGDLSLTTTTTSTGNSSTTTTGKHAFAV
jgi:hypothetical protein